jgi:hypothetical protein
MKTGLSLDVVSILTQLGLVYVLSLVFLAVILRIRRMNAYVSSWPWVWTQTLVVSVLLYPFLYCVSHQVSMLATVLTSLLYVVAWVVNNVMGLFREGIVSLEEKHVYFFETDHRLVHRCVTIATLAGLSLFR